MDTKQRIGSPDITSDLSSKLGYFIGMVLGIAFASFAMGGLTSTLGYKLVLFIAMIQPILTHLESITYIVCDLSGELCGVNEFFDWAGGLVDSVPKAFYIAMRYLISLYVSDDQMDHESFLIGLQYGGIIGFILAIMTDHIARELSYDFLTRITVKQFFVILIISNLVKVISTAYNLKIVSGE